MPSLEKMSAAAQSIIDQHLDAIEASLRASGMARSERMSIQEDVENQIYEMLEARATGNPQENEVRAVIAELDAPESYRSYGDSEAAVPAPSKSATPPSSPPRLSKTAVIGALWAIPFFVCVPLFFLVVRVAPVPASSMETSFLGFIKVQGLIAAMTAPFGTTLLGIIAISQIRHSRGRIYGRGLAVGGALLFPLLAAIPVCLGIVVFTFSFLQMPYEFFDPSHDHHFAAIASEPIVWFFAFLLWVLVACAVTRWIWRHSGKTLPKDTGEPVVPLRE